MNSPLELNDPILIKRANTLVISNGLLTKHNGDFDAAYAEADALFLDPANETTDEAEAERLFDQWEAVYDALFDIANEFNVKLSEAVLPKHTNVNLDLAA